MRAHLSTTCILTCTRTHTGSPEHRELWDRLIADVNALEEENDEHLERAERAMKQAERVALKGDTEGAMR